jgi:transposase-like protein
MSFVPPRCPNPCCDAHREPKGVWYVRIGYYVTRCRPEPQQRYRCRHCRRKFSRQTFRHDYGDRKPDTNEPLLKLLTSGVGLRQAGRVVGLDVHSVQGKVRKFGRTCGLLHRNLSARLPGEGTYVLDEEETFETDRSRPLTVPVLVERKTWFVVDATAGKIRRLARRGSKRRRRQEAHEQAHGRRADESRECVRRTLQALKDRIGETRLTVQSDEKSSYRTLVREMFGALAVHESTPGTAARTTHNPLFPINTTVAMTRDNNGRLRRRSWLVSKECKCLIQQLQLFLVYRNYMRRRFNYDRAEDTPAKLLGLLPRALRGFEVLAWRQDWGELSVDPMSFSGGRTVAQMRSEVA